MAVTPTQTDYDLVQMNTRNAKIKVELLNFNFQTISSLEGKTTSGSIEVDANSDIRRTCNLSLVAKDIDKNMISEGGELWLDKYIKIYQGIDNPRDNNKTVWWNMGIFLINNPNTVYSAADHTISFEGLDLMAKLTGRRNGQLPAVATLVPAGSKIAEVVKKTITQLGGFYNYIIEDEGLEVPYDIKMDMGATIYDLLAELRDLYSNWEMFFDVDGVFHWQKIPNGEKEAVVVNFNEIQPLIISDNVDIDFENVKNNIIVYGRLLDTGEQIMATASDTNAESPFCISKVGQINYIVDDERIYSNELAKDRADYELYLHARLNDSISLEIVPIPWLNDVNIKIAYTNEKIGIEGEYLIQSLSIPLDIGSSMTITASKIYETPEQFKSYTTEYLRTGMNYSSTQTQFPYFH